MTQRALAFGASVIDIEDLHAGSLRPPGGAPSPTCGNPNAAAHNAAIVAARHAGRGNRRHLEPLHGD